MFKQLTWYTYQWHRAKVESKSSISFLKRGQMFARSHSFGISPVSRDCWNKCENTGPSLFANSLRTLGWSSSGPKGSGGFKPLNDFITPSDETTILSMNGANLSVNGTSLYSVLLNASLNWPISSSANSARLAKCRQIWVFSMPVVFTGKYRQILVNAGKYWKLAFTTLEVRQNPTLSINLWTMSVIGAT